MNLIEKHYETVLAGYYSWLYGGLENKVQENKAFFEAQKLSAPTGAQALDLGCGSGFQSIALAQLGFSVTAVDLSQTLLEELKTAGANLPIQRVCDDLLNFDARTDQTFKVVVCMGDTLTHLPGQTDVETLFHKVSGRLEQGGRFFLTFRDLTFELQDLDRFLPVRSDENTVFTCFLEYEPERVKVHDLIYTREATGWTLHKSYYYKIRLSLDRTRSALEQAGLTVMHSHSARGLITLVAGKE